MSGQGVLAGIEPAGPWAIVSQRDPRARALADRHYSRRRPGSSQVGGPFRKLVLLTHDARALWITAWPRDAMDGLDAWRCQLFRNEGAGRSSDLIVAAMRLTQERWAPALPADGWVTWVDRARIASPHPGYCFKLAGWELDREWVSPRLPRRLVRLRAEVR